MQFHNALIHPVVRGFDANTHIQYIDYLKNNQRLPLPYEGFELWQPPLYYILSTAFQDYRLIKLFQVIILFFFSVVSFFFFDRGLKNKKVALIACFLISSLPVTLYMSLSIGNEYFSAILISLSIIYYLITNLNKGINKIIMGILLGFAILAKSTAFVLVGAIVIDQIIKNKNIIRTLKVLMLSFTVMMLIGGWFYVKNIYLFKNPFIASFDFPRIHPLNQPKTARDFAFFSNMNAFFTMDMFNAHHYSFFPGTYFSWFFDGHNTIVPVQPFSKAGALLILFSFPIFIFYLKGFVLEIKEKNNHNFILVLYSIMLFLAYILYNFRLPFFSTVKGSFLLSLILPFAYFTSKGIKLYYKWINYILIYLSFYAIIIIKNFWILPFWYK